jgi:hypothetical protein
MRKALLTVLALSSALTVSAQRTRPEITTITDFVVGDTMYLYNVDAKLFFTEGNAWGTQTSLGDEGLKVIVTEYVPVDDQGNPAGEWDGKTYLINDYSITKSGWKQVFTDTDANPYGEAFVDLNAQANYFWQFAKQADGTYYIFPGDLNPIYNQTAYPNSYFGGIVNNGVQNTVVYPLVNPNELNEGDVAQLRWTFVSSTAYADYYAAITIYKAAEQLKAKIDEAKSRGVDVTAAQAVYDNASSTVEQLKQAFNDLVNALTELDEKEVTPDNPKDYTSFIVNPDFDLELEGWVNEANCPTFEIPSWTGMANDEDIIVPYLNIWGNHAYGKIHQVVEGLPNGIYQLSAGAYSNAAHFFVFAGDMKTEVAYPTDKGSATYKVVTQVTDHTLDLGVLFTDSTEVWSGCDKFRLSYFGSGEDAYLYWLDFYLDNAPDYTGQYVQQALLQEYQSILEEGKNAKTRDELTAVIPKIDDITLRISKNNAAYTELDATRAYAQTALEAGNQYYSNLINDFLMDEVEPMIDALTASTEEVESMTARLNQILSDMESLNTMLSQLEEKSAALNEALDVTYAETASDEAKAQAKKTQEAIAAMQADSSAATLDDMNALFEAIEAAMAQLAIKSGEASDDNPIDYSSLIKNRDFEAGLDGWINEAGLSTFEQGNWSDMFDGENMSGSYYLNLWDASPEGRVYQHLTDMKNGVYEITAAAYTSGGSESQTVAWVFANDAKVPVAYDTFTPKGRLYTVTIKVTDGTIDLGAYMSDTNAVWATYDNFSLIYYGENSTRELTPTGEVDAIESIASDGQKDDVIYDLSGRRVKEMTRGIYIVNGKKVLKR